MKAVNLDGLAHYVWEHTPEWGAGVVGHFSVESDQVASLTKREQRKAYGETLRVELEATYLLSGAEAAEARNVLRILQDTPVRLPFLFAVDDEGVEYQARWYLAYDEVSSDPGGATNLYWTNGDEDLNGRGHIIPTGLGYFSQVPAFELASTDLFAATLKWQESSSFAEALQVAAVEWTQGPMIGAQTVYVFPFVPDFSGAQEAGQVAVDVARDQVGFGRSYASEAYPQLGSRQPQFSYTLTSRAEIATLLRFFLDRNGPVETFWLPCWVGECRLTVDAVGADNTVTVNDATLLGDQRYLQFYGPSGVVTRHITNIAGNVLTLDSALGQAFTAADTVLCTLALARFNGGQLTLTWRSPDLADCEIQFVEVTQEYSTPLGEVFGGTIGELPATCFLYHIASAGEDWHWTSYEKDLNYGGGVWSAVNIEHEEVVEGMAWEANTCQIKMRSFAGNPLLGLMNRTATDRLEIWIAKGNVGDPVTNVVTFYHGFVTKAQFKGAFITGSCDGFGSLFSRNVPRTVLQTGDNYALFDAGNRLVKANWTFTARLTAVAGNVLTLDTLTWLPGALPALPANYFALGYVERPLGGGQVERVPLVSSTAIAAGMITVTMAHGFMNAAPAPPEASWKLVPGYDGQLATAINKFNNLANYGGFPFIPDVNPSLVAIPSNATSGSKKSG